MQRVNTSSRTQKHDAFRSMLRLVLPLVLACLFVPFAHAQFRSSIQGSVTDASGAVVPGVILTLTDNDTNQLLTATTNNSGVYNFNALPPDHFTLRATKTGFQTKTLQNVQLIPEQANSINIQMELGTVSQEVTVSGESTRLLDTETATISGTITSNQIEHMPAVGRDVMQLAQLAPGVFGDGGHSSSGGTQNLPGTNIGGPSSTDGIFKTENGPQIVANGSQNNANGITIDGISTASAVWGGTTVITPTEDSVDNVKVVANNYDAENGRFSGAQIQVTSKSGTNTPHGSLFFKADRPGLNAYQRWNGPNSVKSGTPAQRGLLRDNSRFNQFGGSVGGPIWKDKVFAFFAYETLRNNTTATGTGWYETPEFLKEAPSGSIAAKYLSYPGEGASSNAVISATCADIGLTEGAQCQTIPGKGLDVGSPLKSGLGKHDPTWKGTSSPGVGSGLDGIPDIAFLGTVGPKKVTESQYNGRLDANVTSSDRLTFTIYWVPVSTTSYNGPVRAANLYHHSAINDAFSGVWNHIFTPTLLNEARVNAAGWRWNEITSNPQVPFGLPQANFGVNGSPYGNGVSLNRFGAPGPSVFNQWTYSYQDILTKVAGRHTIKMGGGVTRLYYLNEAPYNARPSYTFTNIWDFLNDAPYSEKGTFNPKTGTPTANREDNRVNLWGFFVQDDFKVLPTLTLNMGLRYSYFGPFSSKQNNLSTVQPGAGQALLTGLSMRIGGNLYKAQTGNFGPQFGFAWNPASKLVIRGGFGLNYNQNEIAITANGTSNPPNVLDKSFCCSSSNSPNPAIIYALPSDVHTLYGYPTNPNAIASFGTNNLPTTGTTNVTGFDQHVHTIYTYHYSLDTEYNVGRGWVATLGYQGSLSRHLILQSNLNAIAATSGIPLNPTLTSVGYYGNYGSANYNEMLAGLKHEFAHQFMLDTEYAWANSMDEGSQPYYMNPYPYNNALAYGRSDYNVRNAFKIFGTWQPKFFGGNNWREKIAGGWSLSGIFNLHSGFPWTPTYNVSGGTLYYQNSPYHTLFPAAYLGGAGHDTSNDTFKSGPVGSSKRFNKNYPTGALTYFTVPNYKAVSASLPAAGPIPQTPGVSRNSLNGPGYKDIDATIAKSFGFPKMPGLGENARLEFRVDAFNVFNNLNLDSSSIVSTISTDGKTSNPSFGQAQKALGARTMDIQLRFAF